LTPIIRQNLKYYLPKLFSLYVQSSFHKRGFKDYEVQQDINRERRRKDSKKIMKQIFDDQYIVHNGNKQQ
jgi:hypothetical protein